MEPNKSSHLTNDKVTIAGEYCAGQKWHNPISYYINSSNRDVIFDSYTNVSSLNEATPCRDNSKGIRPNIVDDSTGIRLLYLAQNVFDMRTTENLVTVTRNDVKTNSDCPVSTGVSIPKEQTVAWFNILWKLQKHIDSLPVLPTHWCALGSSLGATIGYHLHSISSLFRTALAELSEGDEHIGSFQYAMTYFWNQ